MCGGTYRFTETPVADRGLSPRVRGNHGRARRRPDVHRSIPACAGEPFANPPRRRRPAVYPRVCGGTTKPAPQMQAIAGLSPRVRGNRGKCQVRQSHAGSIPACAGEPASGGYGAWYSTVYPRVCGGTNYPPAGVGDAEGLSPRVRGNQTTTSSGANAMGSIPACAGEPAPRGGDGHQHRVYPRVCGGTLLGQPRPAQCGGLSPRVRGNQNPGLRNVHPARSIPACAGEPFCSSCQNPIRGVYPRVCGGTDGVDGQLVLHKGLSPRVRGNRAYRDEKGADTGSIPACAGEPRWQCPLMAQGKVYPRVCGGTGRTGMKKGPTRGLSPRVRGNLVLQHPDTMELRSIPACAGEPFGGAGTDDALDGLSPRVRGNRQNFRQGVGVGGSIPACAGEPGHPANRDALSAVYPRVCGGTSSCCSLVSIW